MLIVKNGARPRVAIDLGRGAVAHARPLDAFEVKAIAAETRVEHNALLDPTRKPKRVWSTIPPERIAEARANDDAATALFGWMHTVLTATASVEQLDGLQEADGIDESGAPINPRAMTPSFEAFELIFLDPQAETFFRMRAPALERIWGQEKNASASGPNGSGSEASISAQDAKTLATSAPAEGSGDSLQALTPSPMPQDADPAPSDPTPPTQPKANSPGNSPAPGASSAAD